MQIVAHTKYRVPILHVTVEAHTAALGSVGVVTDDDGRQLTHTPASPPARPSWGTARRLLVRTTGTVLVVRIL